jgi:hypothetical protein
MTTFMPADLIITFTTGVSDAPPEVDEQLTRAFSPTGASISLVTLTVKLLPGRNPDGPDCTAARWKNLVTLT